MCLKDPLISLEVRILFPCISILPEAICARNRQDRALGEWNFITHMNANELPWNMLEL